MTKDAAEGSTCGADHKYFQSFRCVELRHDLPQRLKLECEIKLCAISGLKLLKDVFGNGFGGLLTVRDKETIHVCKDSMIKSLRMKHLNQLACDYQVIAIGNAVLEGDQITVALFGGNFDDAG